MGSEKWKSFELTGGNGFDEHSTAWDECNDRLFGHHLLFDSRFVGRLLKHFGNGKERVVRRVNASGVTEICLLQPGRLGTWGSFFPSQAQVSPVFVGASDALEGIFEALPRSAMQVDFLGQDPLFTHVIDGLAPGGNAINHATTISIALTGSFDEYWNSRSKNLVKNIRRYCNRLSQGNHKVVFVQVEAEEEMPAAITRYGQLEEQSWKNQIGTAVLPGNQQGHFYEDVMSAFARTGNATVYELWIDDCLAASRLVIHNEHQFIILKTAFDISMAQFAPGRLLLHEVIVDAFRRLPGGRLEFYTNATPDQLDWATHSRTIVHQTKFRSDAHAVVRQVLKLGYNTVIRTMKDESVPVVERVCCSDSAIPESSLKLFALAERQAFDFGWPWFRNLAATVSIDGYSPNIYVGSTDGKSCIVLPMLMPNKPKATDAKGFETYYTTLYQPIIADGTRVRDLRRVIEVLCDDYPALSELRFAPLDPSSSAIIVLRNALQAAGWLTFGYFCFGNWYLPVNGDYQSYFESRKPKMRNTIRRLGKKLITDGGSLEIITEGERVEVGIAAYNAVYAASWKVSEPHAEFVPGLVRMLAETGRLRLGIAWLDGKPIAAQIWVINHGKAGIYKVGYDEEHAAYSPGTLLTAHLMEHVIDRDGVSEVDYFIGDDPYKQTWMTHRRERWGIVAYNPRRLNGMWRLVRELSARAVKALVKRHSFTSSISKPV